MLWFKSFCVLCHTILCHFPGLLYGTCTWTHYCTGTLLYRVNIMNVALGMWLFSSSAAVYLRCMWYRKCVCVSVSTCGMLISDVVLQPPASRFQPSLLHS